MSGILDGISKKNTETNDVTESYWGGPSPAQLRFNRALKKQQNSPENKAHREKFQKEINRIMGPRPVQPKDEPEDKEITEAFDQPYPYEWDKPDPRSYHALAFLDDGSPLDIEFNRQGNNEWHVKFDRNYSYKVTGEGNQQRVFATVIAAMKEFVKKRKPQKVVFSATKTVAPGQKSTSRSSLYSNLISRFATALGYTAHIDDQDDHVVYELMRVQKPVTESSGKTAEGYTWRFEPGREVPMKPDVDANTFIRVKDPTGKTICGIWADVEGDSIEIEYSQVFDERLRGRGVYTDVLRSLSKQYTVISDKDNNNAAAGIYRRLGADYDHRQATHTLRKQGVAEGATVTRIDSKPITDFGSSLKAYKHTDDWSQSGVDTGDDSYWKNKNLKTNTTKGLFAGDPRRTALYATGNAHETRYVEFTQDGQPIVYFDRKDLPAMRSRKTYLTVFDASDFRQLPTGEWFSQNPGKPIKQVPIGDPFKYIASQGWIVRVTDDLDKVFNQVKNMHKAGKIAQYGAEGMNESKQGVAEGFLNEGLAHPVIVVDVQPEYSGMNDGNESSVFPQIINFVNKQTGPVLMFVNAEDQGMSGDTIQDIKQYWDDTICPEEERYTYDEETDDYIENPNCPKINWQRFAIADKGYGYFRSWMDHGIEPATIVATIRELYQQKKSDSRELQFPAFNRRTPQQSLIMGAMQEMGDDPISVDWTSVSQLKRFNGAYIVGGARDQCLREVELLMNAFNIKYKRIDSLIYEGKQGVAEGAEQDYLSQIPNLTWKPVSRSVWNSIQDEGLDEEQDKPKHTDWIMASLTISPEDARALQAFDNDAIEDFNRFDIHLKSRYPGLTDLIDYDRGTVTIVKTVTEQGVAEGRKKKNKKTSRSLGRYFFPGYGYYGSGESGEGGEGGGGEGVAEGGAETSWSNDTGTITLQDILELTKHIKQINLPINDNLKSKLIHWEGNPEEIERVNQVTVSNQFPILIMVDEQGQIDWILDGNHRLHKAIQSQAKTIPAKLIKPSNLNDKAKKIFNIKEQGVAEDEHATPPRPQVVDSMKSMVDVGGIQLNVAIDGAEVSIRPVVDGYQAGYVVFDRDGRTLVPDDLAIDDEFRGRGIAKIIYDYVKSLGFTIRRSSDQTRAGKHFWDKNRGEDGMIWEGTDYMAGHCHVMAIALQQLHPDWQLRAHIGWDEEAEDEEEYRVDHIYIVAPDGTAYDCRGKFANEEKLVGPDETGGVETQFVDIDLQEINNLVQRGELKRFTKQEVEKAIIFIQRQEKELDEACWKGYHKEGMKTMFGKRYPNCVKNTKEDIEENHRIARKPGQPAKSKAHSDLYTDEDPKGTIHGLKFATVDDAHASVAKIKSSGRSHAHKIQAAVAMEQRAKAAGKSSAAAVYRSYINGAKKTNESTEESCPHCNGPMFSEELINEKKDACYYKVKSRYKVWPSAYASGALVQCRKKGASNWGTKSESSILEGIEQTDEDLHKWFKEKWVRFGPDGKIRGACARGDDSEGKPKCLPQSKAQNLGKKGRASAASRKRREDPNPERSGKAINVATKKKTTESSILQGISETKGLPMPGSYEQEYGPFKKKGGYRIMTLTSEQEELDEKWSDKYKRSIDCNHPKGFSQRAHCQGKKKK